MLYEEITQPAEAPMERDRKAQGIALGMLANYQCKP